MEFWREAWADTGVTVQYRMDSQIIGSRGRQNETKWFELQFTVNIAIITVSSQDMQHAMQKLSEITRQWGLTISTSKTKTMVIGGREADQNMVLSVNGDQER